MTVQRIDYLDPAELSPDNHAEGESVRLAVHALTLNPNAYWARLALVAYAYGENALEYDGHVLDRLERIDPRLYECANHVAMSFLAVAIARGIHTYDRYAKPLALFIANCFYNARNTVRYYYVHGIGKGRKKAASGKENDLPDPDIDAEFEERFGSRDVYEIIRELLPGHAIDDDAWRENRTAAEWRAFANALAEQREEPDGARETFGRASAPAPEREYPGHKSDGRDKPAYSATTAGNETQKNAMSRYQNDYDRNVRVVRSEQVGGEFVPDEKTGRKKKVGWSLERLKFLQYDMSAGELEAALEALRQHKTPQYTGKPYEPPEEPDPLPPFDEFREFFLASRKFNTPKRRVDAWVILESLRLYYWEGISNREKILERMGEDFAIKIAAKKKELPKTSAKLLTEPTVRGMLERNRQIFADFMNSR